MLTRFCHHGLHWATWSSTHPFLCHLTTDCGLESMRQIPHSKIHFVDKKIKWRIEGLDVVTDACNTSSQEADGRNTVLGYLELTVRLSSELWKSHSSSFQSAGTKDTLPPYLRRKGFFFVLFFCYCCFLNPPPDQRHTHRVSLYSSGCPRTCTID